MQKLFMKICVTVDKYLLCLTNKHMSIYAKKAAVNPVTNEIRWFNF